MAQAENKLFLHANSGVIISILRVRPEPVTLFGAQSLLGGTILVLGDTSSDLVGAAPECSPWRWA